MKKQDSKRKIQIYDLKFKATLLSFAVILSFTLWTLRLPKAHAQDISLGISPTILKIQATPPAEVRAPITVVNHTEEPVRLSIELKPFEAEGENGQIRFLEGMNLKEYLPQNAQIRLDNRPITELILAPKQTETVSLYINIDKNHPRSDYFFSVVFVTSQPDEANQPQFSQAQGGIATNVLASIGPKGETQGILEEFSAPSFITKGPVPFSVRLKNTSDHYISPTGKIVITNMYGQAVGKVDLLPVNILPDSVRAIPDSNKSETPTTTVNATWPEKLLFGIYSAQLSLSLAEDGPVFNKKIYFVAFPVEGFAGVAGVTFIILLIRKRLRTKRS